MTSDWTSLPEWIEIKIPSKDRRGKLIPVKTRREWLRRWENFFLNPEGMRGEGYETLRKQGTWRGRAIFDPKTGEWRHTTKEGIEGITMYCTGPALSHFRVHGRRLLTQMGRELNQDAVAYADKRGLHIRKISPNQ